MNRAIFIIIALLVSVGTSRADSGDIEDENFLELREDYKNEDFFIRAKSSFILSESGDVFSIPMSNGEKAILWDKKHGCPARFHIPPDPLSEYEEKEGLLNLISGCSAEVLSSDCWRTFVNVFPNGDIRHQEPNDKLCFEGYLNILKNDGTSKIYYLRSSIMEAK